MYCTRCGKEIPQYSTSCPDCNKAFQADNHANSSQGKTNVWENIKVSVANLKFAKNYFFVTVALFLFNIIFSFCKMARISLFYMSQSSSFFGFLSKADEGFGYDDAEPLLAFLRICTIATVLSIVLMFLPILLNKKYKRSYLILNYITMIIVFVYYLFLMIAFASEDGGHVKLTAMAYIFMIETIASFVSTIMFSKKLKSLQKTVLAN